MIQHKRAVKFDFHTDQHGLVRERVQEVVHQRLGREVDLRDEKLLRGWRVRCLTAWPLPPGTGHERLGDVPRVTETARGTRRRRPARRRPRSRPCCRRSCSSRGTSTPGPRDLPPRPEARKTHWHRSLVSPTQSVYDACRVQGSSGNCADGDDRRGRAAGRRVVRILVGHTHSMRGTSLNMAGRPSPPTQQSVVSLGFLLLLLGVRVRVRVSAPPSVAAWHASS